MSFKDDSAVQKPEKLWHEQGLMLYVWLLVLLFVLLMSADIPSLGVFAESGLVRL